MKQEPAEPAAEPAADLDVPEGEWMEPFNEVEEDDQMLAASDEEDQGANDEMDEMEGGAAEEHDGAKSEEEEEFQEEHEGEEEEIDDEAAEEGEGEVMTHDPKVRGWQHGEMKVVNKPPEPTYPQPMPLAAQLGARNHGVVQQWHSNRPPLPPPRFPHPDDHGWHNGQWPRPPLPPPKMPPPLPPPAKEPPLPPPSATAPMMPPPPKPPAAAHTKSSASKP